MGSAVDNLVVMVGNLVLRDRFVTLASIMLILHALSQSTVHIELLCFHLSGCNLVSHIYIWSTSLYIFLKFVLLEA